jgi:hypothetical protein
MYRSATLSQRVWHAWLAGSATSAVTSAATRRPVWPVGQRLLGRGRVHREHGVRIGLAAAVDRLELEQLERRVPHERLAPQDRVAPRLQPVGRPHEDQPLAEPNAVGQELGRAIDEVIVVVEGPAGVTVQPKARRRLDEAVLAQRAGSYAGGVIRMPARCARRRHEEPRRGLGHARSRRARRGLGER